MSEFIMELRNIKKSFPGVQALRGVDFTLKAGEVHALLGENGAGKSTLVKIIMGVYRKDEGNMFLNGREVDFLTPEQAQSHGISMVFQELSLIPYLDVAQNILLGREPKGRGGLIRYKDLYFQAQALVKKYHIDIPFDLRDKVISLSRGQCQIVEILKALSREAKILILDEPTASLTKEEHTLYQIINTLKERGVSIIYISHRLEEVLRICDRITVLRDGVKVATENVDVLNMDKVIEMMTGKKMESISYIRNVQKASEKVQRVLLEVKNLSISRRVFEVSFQVNYGEVVGVTGLIGSGKSEIALALFGINPIQGGEIWVDGQKLVIRSPMDTIKAGIALVPEDRKRQGLVLMHSVESNIALSVVRDYVKFGWVQQGIIRKKVLEQVSRLMIKTPNLQQKAQYLSGGNQQKVVLGKWLVRKPKLLILDEPTVGIDVKAKAELRRYVREMVADGECGVLFFSSDLNDIIQTCDRALVLYRGRVIQEYTDVMSMGEEFLYRAIQGVVA